ncbi:kinase superfamily protein [Thalictrum thalictroides]|uniref:non-specific serine/threonine protein kinase n=1 Tax=Thalictrum thalictroides TaxID=46969 RepID=A0A7J6X7U8_THATH|nr:kinase superfamily protein [Thalictrum thalictroides]
MKSSTIASSPPLSLSLLFLEVAKVLFKSSHQDFKVEIWSAGVTLLYLIVGRTPFTSDPEQNIKDIAKLKGSEDLWEVAKLHNRESSFPVVLFKSSHQDFKVEIWSAGVTLLYLKVGRTPFTSDPEQNIKDIAKLKGSEDLWEVAKLHNRESSFPVELFDIQSLPSTNVRGWCEANTKRAEFLDMIPSSLFNLLEKCLTVNLRLRISAEEALRHEFFSRCHEDLRKRRLLRKGIRLDSGIAHLSDGQYLNSDVKVLHKENMTGDVNV